MPVTNVTKNIDQRQIVIEAEFAAPQERVWALYADPRQLEQVWGPPEFPATFVDHSISVGSRCTYYMTGPEGEKFGGYWQITAVDEPNSFAFDDGFANADLTPNPEMPTSKNVYAFESIAGGTRLTATSTYASAEALQQVLDMGVEEGATSAINQIDAFLREHTAA